MDTKDAITIIHDINNDSINDIDKLNAIKVIFFNKNFFIRIMNRKYYKNILNWLIEKYKQKDCIEPFEFLGKFKKMCNKNNCNYLCPFF